MTDARLFLEFYSSFRNSRISGRYLPPEKVETELQHLKNHFEVSQIGRSRLGQPVYSVKFGNGPVKILAWSQMHGNESTTTKGLFDLFNLLNESQKFPGTAEILSGCTLLVIPMLNPDGAAAYTRENANNTDLNRDAAKLQEPESRILRDLFETFKPDYCLNLHDQRSIFGVGETGQPAILSFLAPALNEFREITETRRAAMQIIALVNEELQKLIPGQVGRFDDSFNENCTGDYFQKRGVPTILFEAGHFPEDYEREKTRALFAFSLYISLLSIAKNDFKGIDISDYLVIPENRKNFCDILFRKAQYEDKEQDVALQYREELWKGEIIFIPEILEIDKQLPFFGHREIDCKGGSVEIVQGVPSASENRPATEIMLNKKRLSIKIQ